MLRVGITILLLLCVGLMVVTGLGSMFHAPVGGIHGVDMLG